MSLLQAVGVHRPHLPLLVPQRFVDLYPPKAMPPLPVGSHNFPEGMPAAASECAGGYKHDPTGGCVANESSFELWEQYAYNISSSSSSRFAGWTGVRGQPLPDTWAQQLRRFYFAAVSHTDAMLGEVSTWACRVTYCARRLRWRKVVDCV